MVVGDFLNLLGANHLIHTHISIIKHLAFDDSSLSSYGQTLSI
jgi:hypothetical protein